MSSRVSVYMYFRLHCRESEIDNRQIAPKGYDLYTNDVAYIHVLVQGVVYSKINTVYI